MAPKKKQAQTMSLNNFLNDSSFGGGSWADEVEDTIGTQPLPAPERPGMGSSSFGAERSFARSIAPLPIPTQPPYTAHVGNLPYDATMEDIEDFFQGCDVMNVRIIEDREMQRPKGFAYVEFNEQDGLKKALDRDGEQINGRYVKVKVADSPRGGDFNRDLSDWTRKGPLTDMPDRGGDRRMGGDFGDRRGPREPMEGGGGPSRDFGNWERRGPLSPIAPTAAPSMSREGSRARDDVRTGSMRERHQSPAASWGEGRGDGSRPPYEARERAERAPTAPERDNAWRSNMKPDARAMSPSLSRDGSEAPSSPAAASATPAGRPKLNLTKRTVAEPADTPPAAAGADSSKASPFGAARPIDTRAREQAIAERKQKELKDKQEADEKAKEERRLAKEAAAKAEAEAAAEAAAKEEETAKAAEAAAAAAPETAEEAAPAAEAAKADEAAEEKPAGNGETKEQALPTRSKEAREPRPRTDPNSRAAESGNWRSSGAPRGAPSGPRRGGGRGGRNEAPRPQRNGSNQQQPPTPTASEPAEPAAPAAPVQDEDGWTTVPNKGGRRPGRPVAS